MVDVKCFRPKVIVSVIFARRCKDADTQDCGLLPFNEGFPMFFAFQKRPLTCSGDTTIYPTVNMSKGGAKEQYKF